MLHKASGKSSQTVRLLNRNVASPQVSFAQTATAKSDATRELGLVVSVQSVPVLRQLKQRVPSHHLHRVFPSAEAPSVCYRRVFSTLILLSHETPLCRRSPMLNALGNATRMTRSCSPVRPVAAVTSYATDKR